MKIHQLIATVALVLAGGSAYTQKQPEQHDIANCKWSNGLDMSPAQCAAARREEQGRREYQQQIADQKAAIQAAKKEQEDEEAARKRLCGKDFGKLRVGMKLDRYEECTEALDYVTETVSKGAVIETFRGSVYLIHAKDGRIVAFTRR